MSALKDRIKGAETAAAMEDSPIAALFKHPQAIVEKAEGAHPPIAAGQGKGGSKFQDLPIDLLDEMEQPFRLHSSKKLETMRDSIVAHGIIQRLIVWPNPEHPGRWEIISGRNRRRGAQMAGYTMMPCEIREIDAEEARLQMLATNLEQRDELLPSEKAWAYRERMELLRRKAGRPAKDNSRQIVGNYGIAGIGTEEENSRQIVGDYGIAEIGAEENSRQIVGDFETADIVAEDESGRQVQRYIRLTYLMPELLEAVDVGTLGFGAGVTLSYLPLESQRVIYNYFFVEHREKISGNLADALRFAGEKAPITEELITHILSPDVKSKPIRKVSVPMKKIREYFPPEATPKEIEKQIVAIVAEYFQRRAEI